MHKHYRRPGPWMQELARLHAEGKADPDIVEALNEWLFEHGGDAWFTVRQVRYYRSQLQLPAQGHGLRLRWLREAKENLRRTIASHLGFGHLLPSDHKDDPRGQQIARGDLPGGDLYPNEARVLAVLCDSAKPMTRTEVCTALRIAPSRRRRALRVGQCCAFRLLIAKGLVVRTGTRWTGRRPAVLYAPAPGISIRSSHMRPTSIEVEINRTRREQSRGRARGRANASQSSRPNSEQGKKSAGGEGEG